VRIAGDGHEAQRGAAGRFRPGMVRLRFLATSAGILTSFALLALMVTILKLTGASLGWGIQFQNPWFIGLMVAVTFLFR
jgi:suppressor for copper-sensitivity B